MNQNDNTKEQHYPPTILGWVARFISLALLTLLIGVISWKVATASDEIVFASKVITEDVRKDGDKWLVPVEITNEGDYTAHLVQMDVTIEDTTETLEIPMIGASETVRYMVSTNAPADSVTHEVVSYEAP